MYSIVGYASVGLFIRLRHSALLELSWLRSDPLGEKLSKTRDISKKGTFPFVTCVRIVEVDRSCPGTADFNFKIFAFPVPFKLDTAVSRWDYPGRLRVTGHRFDENLDRVIDTLFINWERPVRIPVWG